MRAFVDNLGRLRERIDRSAHLILVFKADAYGHGASELLPYARRAGVSAFALASVGEALELRKRGANDRLLVLGTTFSGELEAALDAKLELVVSSSAQLLELIALERDVAVHLHFDTGMHRLGLDPKVAGPIARVLGEAPWIRVRGLMTHVAGTRGAFDRRAREQVAKFEALARELSAKGALPRDAWCHVASTAGVLTGLGGHFQAVRVGMGAFGLLPHRELDVCLGADPLEPVLSLRARVAQTHRLAAGQHVGYDGTWRARRPSWIATVAAGYADGLSVRLSDRGSALIQGRRVPIVGRVSMDYAALDVTDLALEGLPRVTEGTPVTFLGKDGDESIDAWELGDHLGTGPYEVITSIQARVPRILRRTDDLAFDEPQPSVSITEPALPPTSR